MEPRPLEMVMKSVSATEEKHHRSVGDQLTNWHLYLAQNRLVNMKAHVRNVEKKVSSEK